LSRGFVDFKRAWTVISLEINSDWIFCLSQAKSVQSVSLMMDS